MKTTADGLCLDITDYCGRRVIFREVVRQKKLPKRPELRNDDFIHGQLTKAIKEPTYIYEDFDRPTERHVYYYEEYTTVNGIKYTEVVIDIAILPFEIVTAYRPNYIKEEYPNSKAKKIYDKKLAEQKD